MSRNLGFIGKKVKKNPQDELKTGGISRIAEPYTILEI
jgi:hypothetical protein